MNKPEPAVSSITVTGGPYAYGDTITYDYEVEKLKGNEYPMVAGFAFQDANADGTVDDDIYGPDIVFTQLVTAGEGILLAGTSPWATNGGPAVMRLELLAYGSKGGQQSIRLLASTDEFSVAGP